MNSRRAPQWIVLAHPPDEIAQLALDPGPSWPSSRFPAPVNPKSGSMPSQDSGRLNNSGQTEQARPHSGHPKHQGTVTRAKPEALRGSPQGDVELMTQKEVLDFKPAPRLERIGDKRRKQADDRKHRIERCADSASPRESRWIEFSGTTGAAAAAGESESG